MDAYPWDHIDVPDTAMLDRMLDKTKGRLFTMKGAGFLGSLLCDHNFIWDTNCPTAWDNGVTIGWNPKFFCWLTPAERITVLAHELWHTGYEHISRLGKERCPDRWNQAADYVINLALKDDGFVFGDKLMSINPCLDGQYRGMSTEQVYNLLPDNPGMPMPMNGSGSPTDADTSADPGSPTQAPGKPLHADIQPAPAGQKEKITAKVIKAIQTARMSNEAGNLPGEILISIEKFLNPILPWEVLLAKFFTELSKDDYSWKRPSRRHDEEYLPSLMGENGLEHLIYFLDVSGSVRDEDVYRFNSEVKHIHENLQPKRLTLVTFDTKIQDVYEFTDDMPFEKIVIHGRGGTSLDPVLKYIQKHRPTAAVVFSDLFCHPMETNPKVPVLWVVVGNDRAKVHFGKKIHIRNEETLPQ